MTTGNQAESIESPGPDEAIPSVPWHAYGLGAGLLTALLLSLAEWGLLFAGDGPPLAGAVDHVKLLATSLCVFGFVTVPLGLGFGLGLTGLARWPGLPSIWRRLRRDETYRRRHEAHLAGLVVTLPVAFGGVAAVTFFIQKTFVRNMNDPLLSGGFMALSVLVALLAALMLLGVGVVVFGGLLDKLGLRRLARREPRLLRATLTLVGSGALGLMAAAFALLYNPEVWSATWVGFLLATAALPLLLVFVRPLVAWAGVLRRPSAAASALLLYMALSAWTFTGLTDWAGPRVVLLGEAQFAPTLVGLIQRVTDRDGDGQSTLLAGGDCDDGNEYVYTGAPEIPGNGIDDNCLYGDAAPRRAPAEAHTADDATPADVAPELEPEPEIDRRRNVVLLLVDTLRPDHLGYFGYLRTPLGADEPRSMSPRMDALAAESVVFARTYAQAPRTPGSIPSLFFGRYASDLDLENPTHNYPDVRESNEGLFEVLDAMGYFTLAVTSHYYFDRSPGMQQGFDVWDNRGALSISDTNTVSAAPEIYSHLEERADELLASEEPWALFVHYFEPHSRWMAHPEIVEFERADSGRQRHIDRYDAEIAFVDDYVGRTLDLLAERGLDEDTIVVLVSDHGEAFDEHGHFFHGQTLYEEVIRVPFFIRVPQVEPVVIDTPVALLDVAPTLIDLVGGDVPSAYQGRSLVAGFPEVAALDVVSELLPYSNYDAHMVALVRGDRKLIYDVRRRDFEMYDLNADAGERRDIYDGDSDGRLVHNATGGALPAPTTRDLREALIQWLEYH